MEKSWVTFLLPKDEYKKTRILYFIVESFFLFIAVLVLTVFFNHFIGIINKDIALVLLIALMSVSGYVLIRYIFSGIEYVNVFDKTDYRKELKKMFFNGFKFAIIFVFVSSFFKVLDMINFDWFDIVGVTFLVFIVVIIMNYISLRFSFKKNMEL